MKIRLEDEAKLNKSIIRVVSSSCINKIVAWIFKHYTLNNYKIRDKKLTPISLWELLGHFETRWALIRQWRPIPTKRISNALSLLCKFSEYHLSNKIAVPDTDCNNYAYSVLTVRICDNVQTSRMSRSRTSVTPSRQKTSF